MAFSNEKQRQSSTDSQYLRFLVFFLFRPGPGAASNAATGGECPRVRPRPRLPGPLLLPRRRAGTVPPARRHELAGAGRCPRPRDRPQRSRRQSRGMLKNSLPQSTDSPQCHTWDDADARVFVLRRCTGDREIPA